MAPGPLALLQVRGVAAAVGVDLLLREVQFDDAADRAGQELAVVADQDRAGAQAGDELLQPGQAVQVEVVGGLVQQEDVVAGEQQRGEGGAGGLAAGQGRHRLVEADGQAELGGRLRGAFVEVGGAEGEPALQGGGVRVVGSRPFRDQRLGGGVQGGLGGRDAGAAAEEGAYGLPRAAVRLLREVADGGGGRAEAQPALLRGVQPGQQAQQGGLAGAVGADQADHVPGRDHQVEAGEQDALAVAGGEGLGDEGGGGGRHQTADRIGPVARPSL